MVKMSISWNCKQIVNMIKKGKFSFNNIIQRSYVWELARKSDLIHSLIENYPVPPFYARRVEGVYDFLDGKQRMNAIAGYINDEYALTVLPLVSYEPADDDKSIEVDISGKKFSELPEELQDLVLSYTLTIYYYDEITDAQVATLFRKLNNGKPLSIKDRNIASCVDIENVTNIGEHSLFNSIMTAKGLENRKQIPLIMKIWCMLNQSEVSFESKSFNKIMQETVITDEQREELNSVLDELENIYGEIAEVEDDKKKVRTLRKKLSSETHMVSFVPFVKRAIKNDIGTTLLAKFFAYFYGAESGATISDVYNDTVKGGSAKTVNINRRNEELEKAWDDFFAEDTQDLDAAEDVTNEESEEAIKGVLDDNASQSEDNEESLPFI